MIPYTYLLTHTPTGRRYYGVRYGKNCDPSDLWVTYYSSSKEVNRLISESGKDAFTFQVRRIFTCKRAAIRWEHRVLKWLDVNHRDDWINIHNGSTPSPEAQLRGAKAKKPWKPDDPRKTARKEDPRWKEIGRQNLKNAQTPEAQAKSKTTYRYKMQTDTEFAARMQQRSQSMQTQEARSKALVTRKHNDTPERRKANSVRTKAAHARGAFDHIYSDQRNQKISAAKKLNNPLTVKGTCPHCNCEGNSGSLKRWHFDNCKSLR